MDTPQEKTIQYPYLPQPSDEVFNLMIKLGYARPHRPSFDEANEWLMVNYGYFVEINVPDMPNQKWDASVHIPYKYGAHFNAEGNTRYEALANALILTMDDILKKQEENK